MSDTPTPATTASDERTWCVLTHVSAFAGMVVPFGNIIGPLVCWLIKKPESALVDRHGKAALNFQISSTIYLIVFGLLILVLVGLLLLPIYAIFWFVMVIVATIRAADDRDPGYILSIPFLK
ncbi:MAG: DUF4870 domain-containing protein [Gammaproteobacteria bacterium]|nr:DUF4870 domain-containing protein [Gammaproteobacteria bacterium]